MPVLAFCNSGDFGWGNVWILAGNNCANYIHVYIYIYVCMKVTDFVNREDAVFYA